MHGHVPTMLHGDLKPSNICLAKRVSRIGALAKVVDMGGVQRAAGTLRTRGMGTPAFFSPERALDAGWG